MCLRANIDINYFIFIFLGLVIKEFSLVQKTSFDMLRLENNFLNKKVGQDANHQGIVALVETIFQNNVMELWKIKFFS